MTNAEVCDHFIQRELTNDNLWRSYSTKRAYKAYLKRWIVPHWGNARLSEVRTMEVESWLRRLPLAKSSCAKIRNILSVLFNHACRHELFDGNPIRLSYVDSGFETPSHFVSHLAAYRGLFEQLK